MVTMTWVYQMRAHASLTDNCGTNPGWSDWSWSTDTEYPGLFSVYFLMDPYLLPFVLHWLLLAPQKVYDSQRVTSNFKYINFDGRTLSFASLNMALGWRRDNLSYQDLNYCCKGDNNYGNIIFYFLIHWSNLLRKLKLIQYMAHLLIW